MRLKITLLVLLSLTAGVAAAQTPHSSVGDTGEDQRRRNDMGPPEREMLHRAEIRAAEESYKEMLERAAEAASLADQVRASFDKSQSLSREDLKKLERLEKLARKIRGAAGGSDDKEEQSLPEKLGSAVSRIAEVSGLLKKSVEKTSRLVISAAVIEQTNELIELVRQIRQKNTQ
jgi:anion-transporting  ArsA/GET3 family ATPase